ncbi:MAG: phospholipase D-like domain-containing protein, partial [Thermodesulfobacteriota bacterium]
MVKRIGGLLLGVFILAVPIQNAFAIQTDTEYIPADKYFETALNEINSAKVSIYLVMYLVSVSPNQPEAQPSQLLNALVKAKDRGVDVKVILDQSINFESDSLDDAVLTNKNQHAFEFLKRSGVPVFFDESQTFTHSKTLIVDNKTVLLGSTNWSKSALTRNHETNLLVRSEELAKNIAQDLDRIKLQENIPAILTPSIPISKDFVTDKKLLGEMASSSDERSFDTYLYFLKEFDQNKESTIVLDYDNLAKSLGLDKMSPEDYRRQINKVLDKLQDKYKLISFD